MYNEWRMYYLVALGNPGSEYALTRHNVGWLVADKIVTLLNLPVAVASAKHSGRVTEGIIAGQPVTLLYPDTFMNNSGSAVKKLLQKGAAATLIALYDDVALPLGQVRVNFGRGDGGHNGLASIISALGSKDFVRVRVGIAPTSLFTGKTKRPTGDRLQRFVLGKFTKRELVKVEEVGKRVSEVLETIVRDGYVVAMNRFN